MGRTGDVLSQDQPEEDEDTGEEDAPGKGTRGPRPIDQDLARRLRQMREAVPGLTQEKLAADLGVKRSMVNRIESGTRRPTAKQVAIWYQKCGYVLDGIRVGTPAQAEALALALADLPKEEIDSVIKVISRWPAVSERRRGRVLEIIESNEP